MPFPDYPVLQDLLDQLDSSEEWYSFEEFLQDLKRPRQELVLEVAEAAPEPVVRMRRCRNGFSCSKKDAGCRFSHPDRCRHGARCGHLAQGICNFGHTAEEVQRHRPAPAAAPAPPPVAPTKPKKKNNNSFALLESSDSE